MPALNWDIFAGLPGSVEKNFELLCRGVVRHNFGSFGAFRALANQPGVEFHLKLDKPCGALGDTGRWWGWQCKWYTFSANGRLGATRRADIKEGLRKTEIHVPGLTDWVLWTRQALAKGDQQWFSELSSGMQLHLWTSDEVDNLLSGEAAILRSTYFGELVLTPDILRERHEQAIAPIRSRWQPDVHHVGEAERELRRRLGESESWDALRTLSARLRATARALETSPAVPSQLAPSVNDAVATSRRSADTLDSVTEGIRNGDLDLLRGELTARSRALSVDVATAPRRLRAGNHRAGLYATNAVADCHAAVRILGHVETAFSSRVVALLAPAGCGKTHLAAQLTSETAEAAETAARPPGMLLHGRDLYATHSIDDLARRVSIAGQPMPSMEALLAAMDAAGQRARHRLPVFIDGLNESEDPRMWKPLLASLETTLAKYPYVLLVCALRPEFVGDAIPDGTHCLEIRGYGEETREALEKHFHYWKIDATDALLPGFLQHPLTLRLFCEVTNPTRQRVVGVNAMPGSLTTLFERYLDQAASRIFELAPRAHRLYPKDVGAAISMIANRMWESRAGAIELGELRALLNDAHLPWDQSLVRALEQEGILLRMPSNGSGAFVPVYDLLGGHIIAAAFLAKYGQPSFEEWIKGPAMPLLAGDYAVRHPLNDDIVRSLVQQVPQRFPGKQLWQMVSEPLRGNALRQAAHLEAGSFDAATVDALLKLVREGDAGLLGRFQEVRGSLGHPLNAEALDRALRPMTVADRDLRWSEWLRKNQDDRLVRGRNVFRDLERLEQRWRSGEVRSSDRLRARWVMWTLTSTVRRLRDQATRALYWFGRLDSEGLFALTIDSLSVNDPYVGERMLAASYGVVMSYQYEDSRFAGFLKPFLERLAVTLVGTLASAPTYHYLARLYVRGITAFAGKFHAWCLPPSMQGAYLFAAPALVQPLAGSAEADEAGRTLHMDFMNYTLGRLFEDRRNYDMDHAGHQAAVAHVCGIVWALGWREAAFDVLDNGIVEDRYRGGGRSRSHAERYGKKYGWIGFYAYAGLLEERGRLPSGTREFSVVDIDPSFPEKPSADGDRSVPEAWLSPSMKSHERWVREGGTSMPRSLLRRKTIGEHRGPWLAVHGFVEAADRILGRKAWAFISAFATDKTRVPLLRSTLIAGTRPWGASDLPKDHYVLAGEIPWHQKFASGAPDIYRENVQGGDDTVSVEVLAHEYAWESYHSEMNCAGSALVPSQPFSHRFDLRGRAQTFDQFLPDGSRATITLSGVDGLQGDILYIREDLLRQYVGADRAVIWLVFGERDLQPYPSSPPRWLIKAQQQQANSWREVLAEADLKHNAKPARKKKAMKRRVATAHSIRKPPGRKTRGRQHIGARRRTG